MTERSWTPEQQAAIRLTGGSILVSAAAGSGKTAVLVERVVRLITDEAHPCDVDRLLVVTFTNAAAAEMKERIGARLSQLLAENPFDRNLRRQQMLLENAHISTIHSFCLDLIRGHFQQLDLPPVFRIADENETSLLCGDVLGALLEEQYASATDTGEETPFSALSELFSGRDDGPLAETVLRLYDFTRSLPDPETWMKEKLRRYRPDAPEGGLYWKREALRYGGMALRNARAIVRGAVNAASQYPKMLDAYGPALEEFIRLLDEMIAAAGRGDDGGYAETFRLLSDFVTPRLGTLRKFDDDAAKEKVKSERDRAKKIVLELRERLFSSDEAQLADDLSRMEPMVACLFGIIRELSRRVYAEKLARGILDFDDLEQLALRLLTEKSADGGLVPSETAREAAAQYEEILVDEYQDTNLIQDAVFRAVSRGEKNLFMVGDVKQSIYRFRKAMPEIFLAKKAAFRPFDPAVPAPEAGRFPAKIVLGRNFRSRAGVTEAVNFVFGRLMSRELGEIEYNGEEELIPAAAYPPQRQPCFEIHLVDRTGEQPGDDTEAAEARHAAEIIRGMVESGYPVNGSEGPRPCRWSDFCVLMRGTRGRAETWLREMNLRGVPAWAELASGYLSSYEVAVMLSLLRVLDNPRQDVPLASVMLSPMFGFQPDDLANLRIRRRGGSLYTALVSAASGEEGSGDQPFSGLLAALGRLRTLAAVLPADRLILRIYDETGFLNVCEAMHGGERRRANLRLLLDYARGYEAAGYSGLTGFIRFLDRVQEGRSDLKPASALSENADIVRVMTIHKSKGLEFPICILAGLARPFNRTDTDRDALFSPSCGFGSVLRDRVLPYKYTTLPREVVRMELTRSALSEEMRVLYVAMTRAKEKLIATVSALRPEKTLAAAAGILTEDGSVSPYAAMGSRGFGPWLLACALGRPDCGVLREAAGLAPAVSAQDEKPDECRWKAVIATRNGTQQNTVPCDGSPAERPLAKATETLQAPAADPSETKMLLREILRRTEFRYPHGVLSRIPSKVAVSEFAEKEAPVEVTKVLPSFLRGGRLTGAQAGTALHGFMQYADFTRIDDEQGVRAEVERLVTQRFLLPEEGAAIQVEKVVAFTQSKLFTRIRRAEKIWREFRFTAEVPAESLYPQAQGEGGRVMIQGMADLIFRENGSIVVVDYKTDYVRTRQELLLRYSRQIELYAAAVAQIMGGTVAENSGKILYSFHLGEAVPV